MSGDSGEVSTCEVEPEFEGYQLIGDSQLLRFSEQLLNKRRKENNGFTHLGLCVSGQKISDLLLRVRNDFANVSEKVILMIGTNDLLRRTEYDDMHDDHQLLLEELRSRGAEKIILLTVPPVPKLKCENHHWSRLKEFNEYLKDCRDGEKVIVADAFAQFVVQDFRPRRSWSKSISANYSNSSKLSPVSFLKNNPDSNDEQQSPLPWMTVDLLPLTSSGRGNRSDTNVQMRSKRRREEESGDEECSSPKTKRWHSLPNDLVFKSTPIKSASSERRLGTEEGLDKIYYTICEDYFEMSRKDEIHLNVKGLRCIRRLILDTIGGNK